MSNLYPVSRKQRKYPPFKIQLLKQCQISDNKKKKIISWKNLESREKGFGFLDMHTGVEAGCAVTDMTPFPMAERDSKTVSPALRPQPPPWVPHHSGENCQSPSSDCLPNHAAVRTPLRKSTPCVVSVVPEVVVPLQSQDCEVSITKHSDLT